MSKNYAILKVPKDNVGLKNIKIQEINLVNSKFTEVIVYFDLLNISKGIIEEIEKVKDLISKIDDNINIEFNINKYEKKLEENDIEEAISFLVDYVKNEDQYLSMILNTITYIFKDGIIEISLGSLVKINNDKIINFIDNLSAKLWTIFGLRYEINVTSNLEDSKNFKFKPREVKVNFDKEVKKEVRKSGFNNKSTYIKPKLKTTSLNEIDSLMLNEEVLVRGEVFKIELKEIKNGKIIIDIYITDNESSLICSKFINSKDEIKVKVGDIIEGVGTYINYNEKYSVRLKKIDIIGEIEEVKKDTSEFKRIELAAHTNMSEMISTIESKELVERAKYHGHKAIAVTDYGVVHAFPFVARGVKDNEDFKIIYGIEAYVVDDEAPLIKNPKDIYIEEEEFVIFDIETTGFSSTN
ncbi:MAG: PHP domain-containing protein, partial [Streptobacillus sp.]